MTPPTAEPKMMPTRVGVEVAQARVVSASRAGARARTGRCARACAPPSRRRRRAGRTPSPRPRSGRADRRCRRRVIQSIPLSPASAARQVDGASRPSGETTPIPVTATRAIATQLKLRAVPPADAAVSAHGGRARARAARSARAGTTSRSGTASAACSRTSTASFALWSRNGRPLLRYFPELRAARRAPARRARRSTVRS